MVTSTIKTSDQVLQTTISLLQDLFGSSQQRNFAVRLWDGTMWRPDAGSQEPVRFTIVLQHPGALRKMFLPPSDLTLGEAYIYNDFDIEGDIEAVIPLADQFMSGQWGKMEQLRFGQRLLSLPSNTGQARYLPQIAPASWRAIAGYRVRLGRAGDLRRAELWCRGVWHHA